MVDDVGRQVGDGFQNRALLGFTQRAREGDTGADLHDAAKSIAAEHARVSRALANLYPEYTLDETLNLLSHCRFSLDHLKYEYPDELVPKGYTHAAYLRQETWIGAHRRFPERSQSVAVSF